MCACVKGDYAHVRWNAQRCTVPYDHFIEYMYNVRASAAFKLHCITPVTKKRTNAQHVSHFIACPQLR